VFMTYKLRTQKQLCQRCREEIPLHQHSRQGAPRKYCKGKCTKEAQRLKDLEAKRLRRQLGKMSKLVKGIKENPASLVELKELVEEVGRMQRREDEMFGIGKSLSTFDTPLISFGNYGVSSIDYSNHNDTPRQWSERELSKIVKKMLDERKELE